MLTAVTQQNGFVSKVHIAHNHR